jgi:CHAD domain-containing protein
MMEALGVTRFSIPADLDGEDVLASAEERFRVSYPDRAHSGGRGRSVWYLDSFDWRAFRSGLCVEADGDEARLVSLRDRGIRHRGRTCGTPRFWRDFPEGPFREAMRDLLACRALLPLASVARTRREFRVLNADDKTVVRAYVEESELLDGRARGKRKRDVVVEPVRGYERDAVGVEAWLREMGLEESAGSGFEAATAAAGLRPGDYTSSLDLPLERGMATRRAAAVVFRRLLDVVVANEAGIRDDIDTEFLHDFRVAIRRTRSALSHFKDVLPEGDIARYKVAFRDTARSTGRLRDLDVYLLDEDRLRSFLPERLQPGLDALFSSLRAERAGEQASVARALDSDDYRALIDGWRRRVAALEAPGERDQDAGAAVDVLAHSIVTHRFRRTLAVGRRVSAGSGPGQMHALRIQGKKLRYALEFFSQLFPPDAVRPLVRQLKRLQDNLGEYNDLAVQQSELETRLGGGSPAPEAAAIGGLIAVLYARRREVRREFAERFAQFAQPSNLADFERVFAALEGER